MGVAVIWGLAVATFLTLVVVPVMYSTLEPIKRALHASWVQVILREYAVFAGRTSRRRYWVFVLTSGLVAAVPLILDALLGWRGVATLAYLVALTVPATGLAVRRLHDAGRSGWWLLAPLGNVVFLFWSGQRGGNAFGEPQPDGWDDAV